MKLKRTLAWLLVLVMCFALMGCTEEGKPNKTTKPKPTSTATPLLYRVTDGSGNVLTPVASNDMYYVQVNSINPAALDDAITVLVTAADSTETVSVTYNAISYMARKFYHDATDQSLKDLVQAIYDYHIAAESFVAS